MPKGRQIVCFIPWINSTSNETKQLSFYEVLS